MAGSPWAELAWGTRALCLSQALHARHTWAPAVFTVLQVPQHTGACGLQPVQSRGMEGTASRSLLQELHKDREQLPCQDSWLCKNVGFILLVQAGGSEGKAEV